MFTGSTLLTALNGQAFGNVIFEDGLVRRRQFRSGLRDTDTILLRHGGMLRTVRRSIQQGSADNPERLLAMMMTGPTASETDAGIQAVLPAGLDETDILGIGIDGDTLLVNLSPRFAAAVRELDPEAERLCCYAMVNTLAEAAGAAGVCFFWDGAQTRNLAGTVDWSGVFWLNRSLIEQEGR